MSERVREELVAYTSRTERARKTSSLMFRAFYDSQKRDARAAQRRKNNKSERVRRKAQGRTFLHITHTRRSWLGKSERDREVSG